MMGRHFSCLRNDDFHGCFSYWITINDGRCPSAEAHRPTFQPWGLRKGTPGDGIGQCGGAAPAVVPHHVVPVLVAGPTHKWWTGDWAGAGVEVSLPKNHVAPSQTSSDGADDHGIHDQRKKKELALVLMQILNSKSSKFKALELRSAQVSGVSWPVEKASKRREAKQIQGYREFHRWIPKMMGL